MPTIEQIEQLEVMQLPEKQRVALINRVLKTSDSSGDSDTAVQAQWEKEISRRIDLLEQGLTQTFPIEDVFRELDQRLA